MLVEVLPSARTRPTEICACYDTQSRNNDHFTRCLMYEQADESRGGDCHHHIVATEPWKSSWTTLWMRCRTSSSMIAMANYAQLSIPMVIDRKNSLGERNPTFTRSAEFNARVATSITPLSPDHPDRCRAVSSCAFGSPRVSLSHKSYCSNTPRIHSMRSN